MAILIVTTKGNQEEWRDQLVRLRPDLDIRVYPDNKNPDDVQFALAWNPPVGVFNQFQNLKCIASTGAGADHILKDPGLPEHVKITRVVDQRLKKDMTAYLITYVMAYLRDLDGYRTQERKKLWRRHDYKVPEKTRIGIMGMGELGKNAASRFVDLGFIVYGWSKSRKQNTNVQMFTGPEEFDSFLERVNILICLLPLTRDTHGILAKETFDKLAPGAYVINVARGEHLVEEDLLEAISSGQLSGACLDVFKEEPLPEDHPFWANEKIRVTPHTASITNLLDVAPQIIENYRRLVEGQPLINEIERDRGY